MLEHTGHYEYCGVLHIHSKYSDGSGNKKGIIKAAKKAGLDYIVITDHNTTQFVQGWNDGLLILVGSELGGYREGHYLAMGITETTKLAGYESGAKGYIDLVKDQGGIGFAAHPQGLNNTSFNLYLSPWTEWGSPDYTGLEVWSYMRDWADGVKQSNILYYYFYPEKIIKGPCPNILKRWDQLCQTRQVVGIGGADAHAHHLFPFNFLKFLSYERVFRGIRTHLFTQSPLGSDFNESKKLVYDALRMGHCFFAHDFLADSSGFGFKAIIDEEKELFMGDAAQLKTEARLEAKSPKSSVLRLLCNGQLVTEAAETTELVWDTDKPGVYRVEAHYRNKPWVFTNPIYLRTH